MNESVNENNSISLGYDAQTETICLIGIGLTSFILDLTSLFTIFASRSKLLDTEFFILVLISFIDINNKTAILLYFYNSFNFKLLFATITFSYSIVANFCITMNLFYYSLFHLSTLNRSPGFLKLFEIVHRLRNFLIYEIVCFTFSLALTSTLAVFNYIELSKFISDPLLYTLFFAQFSLQVVCQTLIPCCFSLIMYIMSMMFVICVRLGNRNGKYASASEREKFIRNSFLLLKFMFYALVNFFATFPTGLFCGIILICPTCSFMKIRFVAYFGFLCFAFKSISLILIHNILRATLSSYFNKIIRFD